MFDPQFVQDRAALSRGAALFDLLDRHRAAAELAGDDGAEAAGVEHLILELFQHVRSYQPLLLHAQLAKA
jgi:hypothetical protein